MNSKHSINLLLPLLLLGQEAGGRVVPRIS